MARRKTALICGIWLAAAGCDIRTDGPEAPEGPGFEDGSEEERGRESHPSVPPDFGADAGVFPPVPPPPNLGEVVTAKRRPPPVSGGTLALSQDGSLAVAADPDRDLVHLVTLASGEPASVSLPAGSEPGRVALDDAGRAHVVLRSSGELAAIDLAQKSLASRTSVCPLPRGVTFDAESAALIVACADGDLVWLTADSHTELRRVFVERDLRDVVVRNGEVLVSRYRSAELLKLDAEGAVTARIQPKPQQQERFDPPMDLPSSNGSAPVPIDSRQVTLSPTLAWRTLANADGRVLTLHQRSQIDEVIAGPGGYGGGCESITQTAMTALDGDNVSAPGMHLNDATVAVDFALSPDGLVLVVSAVGNYLQGSGTLLIYDAGLVFSGSLELRGPPCGFANLSEGFDFQATSVSFGVDGKLYVQSREPAVLVVFELDYTREGDFVSINGLVRVATYNLHESSARDTGHDLFHGNVGTGIACASCHGEALDDGHVWDFRGFGPRRTQNMGGGLLSTAPFHWEGDMPSFQHLVDEVMTGRMGGFAVEPRYADALGKWIDAQPALKLPPRESPEAKRGKALFESAEVGCAACHSGSAFTNNQSYDVGTGGKFQVPSLVGVTLRAPLMHDGCAANLAERFDPACGGGDLHGKTSHLSEGQIRDLVAYLEDL